jgi:hypothetical protein
VLFSWKVAAVMPSWPVATVVWAMAALTTAGGYAAPSLFVWLISHQPAVHFSQNTPVISNQPALLFSQNKSASAISHQPNEHADTMHEDFVKYQLPTFSHI